MSIDSEVRSAVQEMRQVQAEQPRSGARPEAYAAWREQMTGTLEALSDLLRYEENRLQARAEADAAKVRAIRVPEILRSDLSA